MEGSTTSAGTTGSDVNVDFVIRFGKETVELTLPITATIGDVKTALNEQKDVPVEKQRLIFNAPVGKDKRRDPAYTETLAELFPAAYLQKIRSHAAQTAAGPQHIKVTAMLLGSSTTSPLVDSRVTSEISRLVSTTVEHDGRWYRCCYGKGYLRQTAYVCRTCVGEGRADPDHAMCLACAEMCHGNHEVEEWGVRYCMRCDCCTRKCWKTPPPGAQRMPRLSDYAQAGEGGGVTKAAVMSNSDVSSRFEPNKKRSRSSTPQTPKRTTTGSGGSPVSGVRVAAVANAPSPFSLQEPPTLETRAVTAPLSSESSTTTRARTDSQEAFPSHPRRRPDSPPPLSPSPRSSGSGVDEEVEKVDPKTAPNPPAEQGRCMFIVDSSTGKPPLSAVLPANAQNRYPRNPMKWCFCEIDQPAGEDDSGGIVCLLCTTCFWSDHIRRLHTDHFRRVACYGDVVQGDTVSFKCLDCNTAVCAPCRQRCHKNHTVEEDYVVPSKEEGTDNEAPAGVNFSCGCRGLCSIAEAVPEEEVDDPSLYAEMPQSVAISLMENDIFSGFICAHCIQENPWLLTDDLKKCYNGQLPDKVTGDAIKPIVPCGVRAGEAVDEGVFPLHGMVLPVNVFTEEATCGCEPCRAAFRSFAPRATEDATEMIVELHDECDNCGVSLKDRTAFMCQTCELNMEKAFMLCTDCNAQRELLVQHRRATGSSASAVSSAAAPPVEAQAEAGQPPEEDTPQDSERPTYQHNLDHEFVEDTYENVYTLAGMQMMNTIDAESLSYLQNNWESVKDHIQLTNGVVDAFGQVPLSFSEKELETMASEPRPPSTGGADGAVTGSSNKRNRSQSPGGNHDQEKKPKGE